jgi:two-component system chemotaxis response regulator CheB
MRPDMDLTFNALQAGALTVVLKPGLADPETCNKVVQAVRLMAEVPVVDHWRRAEQRPPQETHSKAEIQRHVKMIGLASSTGGPAALATVLGLLPDDFPIPILVVQHVTRGFAVGLAEWLDSMTSLRVVLAGHGETPRPGTILVAPDDYHMRINKQGVVELCREPPYKAQRPSANYLFDSMAHAYGSETVGVVLTGIGDDGAEGLEALHQVGGLVIAQEEQSCVVYDMPQQAIARNIADRVLTPNQIAKTLDQLANREGKRTVADE